jgi:Protein of unknown function (DUF3306)
MTEPDNFISRWARLKRESGVQRREPPLSVEAPAGCAETSVAQPQGDAAAEEPFDPASLPSIEAITADTDIRAFLQSRVPAGLTRAALQRAWAADPAIRDFIGIAENQWDFNDPNAIPGFGPLEEADRGRALLAKAIETSDEGRRTILEISSSVGPSGATDPAPAEADRSLQQEIAHESPSADAGISGSSMADNNADVVTERVRTVEGNEPSPNRRHHGGALPR